MKSEPEIEKKRRRTRIHVLPRRSPLARPIVQSALAAGAVAGCGCAVFLSLRPTGALSSLPWMPDAIGHWADVHGRIRNLPAYFLLAWPFLLLASPDAGRRAVAAVMVGVLGTLLEFAERLVPSRWFEWRDILWSWAGVIAAWLVYETVRIARERVRREASCPAS